VPVRIRNRRHDMSELSVYLKELINVEPNVVIVELWVEASEVCIVDILEDKGGCFALRLC
jgi:hypothetical protein